MRLNVFIDDASYALEVPDDLMATAPSFIAKIDRDLDRGWQMSRDYVDHPDTLQRCQIVADRLLTSMTNGNQSTALLMAAYILTRAPGATGVNIDTEGEIQNTEILFGSRPAGH
ncbi:MAG: hypothetical protein ACYCRH_07505 [Acidiferrobacteraceae bacterium]